MFPIEDVIGPQRLFSTRDNIDKLVRFPIEVRIKPERLFSARLSQARDPNILIS